jgi:catechol 2,3-dioxygenase-like lactoylglutathione lyase family enzyme
MKVPELVYDGGTIFVSREQHASTLEWFEKNAGWKRSGQEFRGEHYIKTELQWGVWVECNDQLNVPEAADTNVHWCFKTRDLIKFRTNLLENGERVSEVYRGPLGHDYFDFWVGDVRMTAQGAPEIENEGLSHDWVRIGVIDLERAKDWYHRYLGMPVLSEHPDERYVVMGMRFNFQDSDQMHPIWVLEQLSEGASTAQKDESGRPYLYVDNAQFSDYHRFLREEGLLVSDVQGNPQYLALFHLFDPDGNRLNFNTFKK